MNRKATPSNSSPMPILFSQNSLLRTTSKPLKDSQTGRGMAGAGARRGGGGGGNGGRRGVSGGSTARSASSSTETGAGGWTRLCPQLLQNWRQAGLRPSQWGQRATPDGGSTGASSAAASGNATSAAKGRPHPPHTAAAFQLFQPQLRHTSGAA